MPKYKLTLEDFLTENDNLLDPIVILKIMRGIFGALQLVHKAGYTHNDIKTNNIMLDSEQNAYLVDLGFTTRFLDGDN
jgi:serine/threonine protein kinase